jgi:tetratricopeptide (TPR) repeat protein
MDENWKHFNRRFIVIYEPAREATVRQILGDLADPVRAAEMALEVATTEVTANPRDGHAWFNIGTSLTVMGEYERAATAFDRARREGVPWRMLWYQFEPFEAYYGAGRYDELLSLASSNLNNGAVWVEETHYWQGRAYAAQGRANDAANSFRSALRYNPRYQAAQVALGELES